MDTLVSWPQCLGRFLDIIGQDPSDSKFNWLHVVIFRIFFINLEEESIDSSSKMMGNFPEVLNSNRLFPKPQPVHL